MVSTSNIASSGVLPVSLGTHLSSLSGPSVSDASRAAAISLLSAGGAISVPATAVSAGKPDGSIGNSPKYIPLDTRSQPEPQPAPSPDSLANVIGGYTLDGHAFPAILYSSQYFAQSFSQSGSEDTASSEALQRAVAEAASESYHRAALLTAGSAADTVSATTDGTVSTDDPASQTDGTATAATTPGMTPAQSGKAEGDIPVKTPAPAIPGHALYGSGLPVNDNQSKPKLVVSHDRATVRASGAPAYQAMQRRNDTQTVRLPATSASV